MKGKRHRAEVRAFLQVNIKRMPSIMLSYACEQMPVDERHYWHDKISEEIEICHRCISDGQEELDGFRYLRDKFEFIKEIIDDSDNAKRYELIYTKC